MSIVRCTQKLLKELRVKPTEVEPGFGYIGEWHANLLRVERRKGVLFTNNDTLYSIFVFGLKRAEFDHLDEVFRQSLFRRLRIEGFSQIQIEKVLEEYQTIHFAKTNNRSVLGSMNDLAFQMEGQIISAGGIGNLGIDALNDALNRIPMGNLNYRYSIEALKDKLNQNVS
jgi:hypothetical protein